MDVFHITDHPRKLTKDSVITYIEQSLGTWNGSLQPAAALEGLTVLGADRTGLISEVFVVMADMDCNVMEARAWSHRGHLAYLVYLHNKDALVVEELRPQLYQKTTPCNWDDRNGSGIGLFYLGNLVKRKLYNLELKKSCS